MNRINVDKYIFISHSLILKIIEQVWNLNENISKKLKVRSFTDNTSVCIFSRFHCFEHLNKHKTHKGGMTKILGSQGNPTVMHRVAIQICAYPFEIILFGEST